MSAVDPITDTGEDLEEFASADEAAQLRGERTCRECGCSDDQACVLIQPAAEPSLLGEAVALVTCHWVEDDLCSACAPEQPIWVRPGRERVGLRE